MNEPMHMWPYWRDKKGIKEALTDYFPGVLRDDPIVRTAWAQIQMAELALEARMTELAAEEQRRDE